MNYVQLFKAIGLLWFWYTWIEVAWKYQMRALQTQGHWLQVIELFEAVTAGGFPILVWYQSVEHFDTVSVIVVFKWTNKCIL